MGSVPANDSDTSNKVTGGEFDSICEVLGDCQNICELPCPKNDVISDFALDTEQEFHISKSKNNTFSIACWLQNASQTSADLQEDMEAVLTKIELLLSKFTCSWENVLYIHLYIADMNEFARANEAYVKFIRQENCCFGVPSRSTIELPLSQVGLGKACIEVLVSNDHTKNVLHVQSISCWAPSCIGPYSQATLHRDVLYMAGQLGLDPPTMLIVDEGPASELKQALENSEAVANCFNCSVALSALFLIIYCSKSLNSSDRIAIENQKNVCLTQMKLRSHSQSMSMPLVGDPIVLYVLVPDLPKRALVEVKPMLYTGENVKILTEVAKQDPHTRQAYWGFQYESWHSDCCQECIVPGRVVTAIISVTEEVVDKICSLSARPYNESKPDHEHQIARMAEFCIYLVDKVLLENDFSWDDIVTLRIYFATILHTSHGKLSTIFTRVFSEFSQMSMRIDTDKEPIFNLVPVLGAGRSATSMDDILTCELYAKKS